MIFHITTLDTWEQAVLGGSYRAESLEAEGFIHLSTAEQVEGTANLYYQGQSGLVLLVVDPERLHSELRHDPPAGTGARSGLFPHLYGPLNVDAVVKTVALEPDASGRFTIPLET
jgi:uncharacterized protein (DUF952 family)